ncbi:hypothetical protein D3C86_1179930 [compost metagenome]
MTMHAAVPVQATVKYGMQFTWQQSRICNAIRKVTGLIRKFGWDAVQGQSAELQCDLLVQLCLCRQAECSTKQSKQYGNFFHKH